MKIINVKSFGMNVWAGEPDGILSGIVERLFELKGKPDFKLHRLLPTGYSEILFNIGDTLFARNSRKEKVTCRQYLLSGIKTGFLDVISPGFMHCFGIRFKVNGMKKLFNIFPEDLTDKDYSFDEVIPREEANHFYEILAECKTPIERINTMGYLLSKKIISSKSFSSSELLVKEIINSPLRPVSLLEKSTGYSRQYLHRVFKLTTGISIKKYQQIKRVSSVVKSLDNKHQNLTGLACQNGYFDQSHFIKDFKQLTGFTPKLYLSSVRSMDADPYFF